ncbi:MAG TPA: dihydroorotate dehydrogenase-like protein, partial [Actinomycetes bacterium]|nr:dihydroorotate dehydrogenase-like protein [Actinomycetes bacterium]
MADLRTRYLGMELRSPLVASSSPLTGTLDGLRRLEAAGAGAVVLPSLFEEELAEQGRDGPPAGAGPADRAGYGAGPAAYLSLVTQARRELSIPVIASLNGASRGGWSAYATRLEAAGAHALELNVYYVSSRPGLSGSDVEWHYLDVVRAVRRATSLPLAVKLSPYFSSLVNLAGQLVESGTNGLVLFNRFYQPDIDIEALQVLPALELSSSTELRLPLRWIAILHRRWGISLAASTGIHTATDVVKV